MDSKIIEKLNSSSKKTMFNDLKTNKNNFLNGYTSSLEMIEGRIISTIGEGTYLINEYTIATLAFNYSRFLNDQKMKNILIVHDGTFFGILFSKIFASSLINGNINAYLNYKNQSISDSMAIWILQNHPELEIDGVVSFTKIYKNDWFNISLYQKNGLLLSQNDSDYINSGILNANYLTLEIKNTEVPKLKQDYTNDYIDWLKTNEDLSNISVFFSIPSNFNNQILNNFLIKNNIKNKINLYSTNVKNKNKITRKSLIKTFGTKTDVIINFTEQNNYFEFIVKHKKRKKFLTMNEMAILYTHYKILKNEITNKKIIFDYKTNDFLSFYAKKNNINNIKSLSLNIELNNLKKEDIFLATNGSKYFVTEENCSFITDPLLNIKIFLEMTCFFKKQNKTLYDVLIDIYQKEKVYRFNEISEKMDYDIANSFFKKLQNQQKIDDTIITRKRFLDQNHKIFEIILENNTKIIFEYLDVYSTLKTYFSIWENKKINNSKNLKINEENKKDLKYVNLVALERTYSSYINDLKNSFGIQKFSWKTFFKYSCFLIIFILFLWFIFTFIFGSDKNLFKQIQEFLRSEPIYGYLLPFISLLVLVQTFINCWLNKRIFNILNQKIKLRHLMVSSIIGMSVSTITPMIYGGESVSYWYLRRKGVERAPLAASFLVQSLLFQINLILFSIIFIPIGIMEFFPTFLGSHSVNFKVLITLIILGFFMDIFSGIMIFMLTFNMRFQEFIVRNLNKFIEWIPFIISRDSSSKGAKLQYEFSNINKAAKEIFTSNVWYVNVLIFIELLSYKIISRGLDWSIIFAISTNMIKPEYPAGGYFHLLAGNTLVRCVNAINFITPSGLGISDWAYKNIMYSIFIDSSNSGYKNVNVAQTLNRIIFTILWVVISALLLFTVYIGESRIDKYKKIEKTLTKEEIQLGNIKTKTTFYRKSIIYWILGSIGVFASWYLIFKYVIL